MRGKWKLLLVLVVLSWGCSGEAEPPSTNPVVFVGIDGASWLAIRDLWEQDRLPHLRALAHRGVSTDLQPVADVSPIIWTSFVTGVRPERHGITDFLLPTAEGDVPVSSTVRRVPAIWNMLSTLDRRVAALSWWASWPAEEVNGIVVSDRALKTSEKAVYPPEFWARFQKIAESVPEPADETLQAEIGRQDEVIARVALDLMHEPFDLTLIYLRGPDVVSHPYWKYFRVPESESVDPEKIESFGEQVPLAYEAVDRILGQLVAAAPENANIFVTSDHGFTTVEGEEYRMLVDLNAVLEHLGYLVMADGKVDWQQTRAVTWNTPPGIEEKLVRFGVDDRDPMGPLRPDELERERQRLAADLAKVVNKNGAPLFSVRAPKKGEIEQGADLTVVVHKRKRAKAVFFEGVEIEGVMQGVEELTGTHSVETPGVFIAAGPDIDTTFGARAVHSLDITPTLLFALGLPVAEDFDGKARVRLLNEEFRERHPLTTIPTWGVSGPGTATASEVDEELKKELQALGYID
jgi:predicted AlkP superfamily phosphohydrolase/phosphomutase